LIYLHLFLEPKIKSIEEKLNNTGIKIKWSDKANYTVNKETIRSIFQEYGKIEDIVIKDDNKAFILFNSFKAVQNVLDNGFKNTILTKYFKVKKFMKNDLPEEMDIHKIKGATLDSNILNTIKNYKFMQNYEYMKSKDEKRDVSYNIFYMLNFISYFYVLTFFM